MFSQLLIMACEALGELWLPLSPTGLPATPRLEIHASTMPSSLQLPSSLGILCLLLSPCLTGHFCFPQLEPFP